jgi:hypothetical protein
MNGAIQNQLALNYDVSVNVVFDDEKKRLTLINTGRTNVFVWGNQVGDGAPRFEKEARTLLPGASYSPSVENMASVLLSLTPNRMVPVRFPVPLEVFLKNEKNEEFVEHAYLRSSWDTDVQTNKGFLTVRAELVSVQPKIWSRQKK